MQVECDSRSIRLNLVIDGRDCQAAGRCNDSSVIREWV
jgi:hypothetical protein